MTGRPAAAVTVAARLVAVHAESAQRAGEPGGRVHGQSSR
jgi:hypothetical protein